MHLNTKTFENNIVGNFVVVLTAPSMLPPNMHYDFLKILKYYYCKNVEFYAQFLEQVFQTWRY